MLVIKNYAEEFISQKFLSKYDLKLSYLSDTLSCLCVKLVSTGAVYSLRRKENTNFINYDRIFSSGMLSFM